MREIYVSCAGDPVHAGDKALTWETPTQRGMVKRYGKWKTVHEFDVNVSSILTGHRYHLII